MKLSQKIILIQIVIIIIVMLGFGVYTYRSKNTELLNNFSINKHVLEIRLLRDLEQPLWNFDTEEVMRLKSNVIKLSNLR